MAGDRARVSYDPSRKWRGVIAQQGRVTVEADWNEAATIGEERDRHVTLDVVGPVGTPDDGYAVTAVRATGEHSASTPDHLTIGKGTLYLGGERLDLDEQVHYSTQPDWLDHSTDPLWKAPGAQHGRHELVYLLATEQEVSAVEDPALADVALGGPDTMQRRRILQRFVRYPSESGRCDGSRRALEKSLADHGLQLDPASMMAGSTARLKVSFPETPPPPNVSQPVPTGAYLGAENQMIRVMVTGIDHTTHEPTIVWGFDDASFLYRVTATPDSGSTTLTLASAPVDSYHYPAKGQAVELLRDAAKLTKADYIASPAGYVSALAGAYDPASRNLKLPAAPGEPPDGYPPDYLSRERTPQLYLRVWQATAHAQPGKPVPLGDTGVAITLTSDDHRFHIGDFWRFALRPIRPAIVYPERYLHAPQPPDGPRTWACALAVLTWDEEHAKVSRCIPRFAGLTETAGRGGCCTVDVGPEDVDGGAALQSLLAGYAHQGPTTICLEPGTYTLRAPLVLGPELDGITLQACRDEVVLRAPEQPGEEFVRGLIAVRDATSVTIRGVELVPPRVRFSPAEGSFSGMHPDNHDLLREFSRGLHVAIGISVHNAVGLAVENCTFRHPDPDSHPDPGQANSFSAGIFATGAIEDVEITGCTFEPASPPAAGHRHRRRRSADEDRPVPWHDLATGGRAGSAHQLSFGYLQVPASGPDREIRPHRLDDATIERCVFRGMTVPALVMARLGTLRVNRNTVRSSYGGFWFVSLADPELSVMFDRIAVGNTDAYREFSVNRGGAALLDRVLVIATAIGQVLPAAHPAGGRPVAGRFRRPDEALLALARQTFSDFYTQATESAERPHEIDALFRNPDNAGQEPPVPEADAGPGSRREGDRDRGRPPSLRLDLGDCQVDDIIADSHCGAGLLVADFTAGPGSVLIHDNRIRSRFPGGETVFVGGIREACVTGNVVANEVEHEERNWKSHSMGLHPATTPPAVAITGNVFVGQARLPRRHHMPHDAHLENWQLLNTVIDYAEWAGQRDRPESGPARGETEQEEREERAEQEEREERAEQEEREERAEQEEWAEQVEREERAEQVERPGPVEREERAEQEERPGPEEREERPGPEERPEWEDVVETNAMASVPARSHLRLRVTQGAEAGRAFDLHQGDLTIGRRWTSKIRLEDPAVSHRHAILRVRDQNVTIEDLHSTNGTRVNDVAIEQETPLAPGDQIDVGGVLLLVERAEPPGLGE
jgi:hypothetical protein